MEIKLDEPQIQKTFTSTNFFWLKPWGKKSSQLCCWNFPEMTRSVKKMAHGFKVGLSRYTCREQTWWFPKPKFLQKYKVVDWGPDWRSKGSSNQQKKIFLLESFRRSTTLAKASYIEKKSKNDTAKWIWQSRCVKIIGNFWRCRSMMSPTQEKNWGFSMKFFHCQLLLIEFFEQKSCHHFQQNMTIRIGRGQSSSSTLCWKTDFRNLNAEKYHNMQTCVII